MSEWAEIPGYENYVIHKDRTRVRVKSKSRTVRAMGGSKQTTPKTLATYRGKYTIRKAANGIQTKFYPDSLWVSAWETGEEPLSAGELARKAKADIAG